jgi:peptidyl-prolyl cis-trans isomerase A (cyclophilin A)
MTAKRRESDRRRSRPVQKRSAKQKIKRNKPATFLAVVIVLMLVFSVFYVVFTSLTSNDETDVETSNPIAVFDTTVGEFKVELYQDKLPNTCANFIKLVNDGFYDGMIFHRVKDDFMIQAGRYYPDGSQSQSPYGPIDLEIHQDVEHVDGAISMGQTPGDPNSATSEFFICDNEQRGLDDDYLQNYGQRGYAAFGVTIEGIEVVRDIASTPHDNSLEPSPGGGKPLENIIINSISIINE